LDWFDKQYKVWQGRALTPEKRDSEALLRSADRILAALGMGKQSEQYKRVKAILDQLMT
jgi:hypothetical protein